MMILPNSEGGKHETLPATGKLSKMKQKGVSLEHLQQQISLIINRQPQLNAH